MFQQWWSVELWRGVWPRSRANKEWDLPNAISTQDGSAGKSTERDEDSSLLLECHKNDRFPKGWPPINVPETKFVRWGAAVAIAVPRLQPLVPARRARLLEWALVCRTSCKPVPEATSNQVIGKMTQARPEVFYTHLKFTEKCVLHYIFSTSFTNSQSLHRGDRWKNTFIS